MLEVGGELDFLEEPVRAQGRGQLRPEHLDRHPAAVLQVLG